MERLGSDPPRRKLGTIVRLSDGTHRVTFHEGDAELTWDPPFPGIERLAENERALVDDLRRAAQLLQERFANSSAPALF